MRLGRVFLICAILSFLLLPSFLFQDYGNGRPVATYLFMSRSFLVLEILIFVAGNPVSAVLPSLSVGALNLIVCFVNNSSNFAGNQPLSSGS